SKTRFFCNNKYRLGVYLVNDIIKFSCLARRDKENIRFPNLGSAVDLRHFYTSISYFLCLGHLLKHWYNGRITQHQYLEITCIVSIRPYDVSCKTVNYYGLMLWTLS